MLKKTITSIGYLVIIIGLIGYWHKQVTAQSVRHQGDKTYLVDQYGENWDISQAVSLGFKPKYFQYGIGRNTIKPVDDHALKSNGSPLSDSTRIIGVRIKGESHAYSVSKLARHEIANTIIGDEAITVGY